MATKPTIDPWVVRRRPGQEPRDVCVHWAPTTDATVCRMVRLATVPAEQLTRYPTAAAARQAGARLCGICRDKAADAVAREADGQRRSA